MPVTASLSRASVVALLGNDPIDFNGGIGTIVLAVLNNTNNIAAGATVAGSALYNWDFRVGVTPTSPTSQGNFVSALAGTWRNIGSVRNSVINDYAIGLWQRIA